MVLDASEAWLPARLAAVERRIAERITDHGETLAADARATLEAGGKRLRPMLVLLCAGVISFLLRHGNGSTALSSTLGNHSSSEAILRSGVVVDPVSVTSYRLTKADTQLGWIRPNEGRQTL
jgi:geranylgeranyl pyrophosphate synthase